MRPNAAGTNNSDYPKHPIPNPMKSSSLLGLAAAAAAFAFVDAGHAGTITNDMVVHLPFDGDYANRAPSSVTAAPVNTVSFKPGRIGSGALRFSSNPTNSEFNYVTLGTPPELNFGGSVDLSVSMWVKFTGWKDDPAFLSNKSWASGDNVGWVVATGGDGRFQWNFTDGNGRRDYDGPGGTISDGQWHHLAVSFDRDGNASAYLDGVLVDSRSIAPGTETLDSGLPTNIGQDGTGVYTDNGDAGIDDGMIDDVAIWRRALTGFEIQRIYQYGTNGVAVSDVPDPAVPAIVSTDPAANAINVPTDTAISVMIHDGALPLDNNTVQLTVNGSPAAVSISKAGNVSTVTHQPSVPFQNDTTNRVRIVFGDGVNSVTSSWSFVVVKLAQTHGITGHWDFDHGDLSATIGRALQYNDGPAGLTANGTSFGSTTSFGIPGIQGNAANVMSIKRATNSSIGYLMNHGALPNGVPGATKVNQWTLIMDILIPNVENRTYFSFIQTDGGGDGDLFARFSGGTAGIGITGSYQGSLTAGQWHRVAFAVDSTSAISKYIDGVKAADQTSWDGIGANGRHALLPTCTLFADDDSESMPAYVNSIQIRNYKMSDAGVAALGGPTADGIPLVSGQWDFNDGNLAATIGTDITPRPGTEVVTAFETTVFDDGAGNVMRFNYNPADLNSGLGYILPHGILPNGGGQKVNQYSLIMDIFFASSSGGFRSLWQTETTLFPDGDLFVSDDNGIGISSQYQGDLTPDEWHRVVFTFDLTKRELGKYIDGSNVVSGPVGSAPLGTGRFQYLSASSGVVDGRWSLGSPDFPFLFADEDGEIAAGSVNSIQTRPVVLTPSQVALLGRASAAGIPVNIPPQPTLTIKIGDFGFVNVLWPDGFPDYILERSNTLGSGANWAQVIPLLPGFYEESEVPNPGFFYRLRKVQ